MEESRMFLGIQLTKEVLAMKLSQEKQFKSLTRLCS